MNITKVTKIKAKDMRLADMIQCTKWFAWGTAIVKQITEDSVVLFRPYGTTADFSYTGGVICYIGIEEYSIPVTSDCEYVLLSRKELK